ncbi:uncharacterized protein [Ptychodera flava]|uniref:uncharacterized protein n=1 Tax=Ptychodera flava TaxID=63121 RepID=UPI003969F5F3
MMDTRIVLIQYIAMHAFRTAGIVPEGGIYDCYLKDTKVFKLHVPETPFLRVTQKDEVYGIFDSKTATLRIFSQRDVRIRLVCTIPMYFKDVALKMDNDKLIANFFPNGNDVIAYDNEAAESASLKFNKTHYLVDFLVNHKVDRSYSVYITMSPDKIQEYHVDLKDATVQSYSEEPRLRSAAESRIVKTDYITLMFSICLLSHYF